MSQLPVVLLAEDREDDILLIQKAFEAGGISCVLQVARDGEEVIDYMEGRGRYSDRDEYPLPDLLLLDIKMPKMDGFEVLKWMRAQPELKSLRIVVLTSSSDIRDVNVAYRLGANSFMVKEWDFANVLHLSKVIREYWLNLSKTPRVERPAKKNSLKPDN